MEFIKTYLQKLHFRSLTTSVMYRWFLTAACWKLTGELNSSGFSGIVTVFSDKLFELVDLNSAVTYKYNIPTIFKVQFIIKLNFESNFQLIKH